MLGLYRDDERTRQITEALGQDTPARLLITGMMGAQESFVLTAAYLSHPQYHLLVANDKEEAAYIQNNIANLFEKYGMHARSK